MRVPGISNYSRCATALAASWNRRKSWWHHPTAASLTRYGISTRRHGASYCRRNFGQGLSFRRLDSATKITKGNVTAYLCSVITLIPFSKIGWRWLVWHGHDQSSQRPRSQEFRGKATSTGVSHSHRSRVSIAALRQACFKSWILKYKYFLGVTTTSLVY